MSPGMALPRYTTQIAKTTNRLPKREASIIKATWVPLQRRTIQANSGTQQWPVTPPAVRFVPAFSGALRHHSYSRCSRLATFTFSSQPRNVATVSDPQPGTLSLNPEVRCWAHQLVLVMPAGNNAA